MEIRLEFLKKHRKPHNLASHNKLYTNMTRYIFSLLSLQQLLGQSYSECKLVISCHFSAKETICTDGRKGYVDQHGIHSIIIHTPSLEVMYLIASMEQDGDSITDGDR